MNHSTSAGVGGGSILYSRQNSGRKLVTATGAAGGGSKTGCNNGSGSLL